MKVGNVVTTLLRARIHRLVTPMVDISDAELLNRISERLFKYREASAEQMLSEIDRLIEIEYASEAAVIERGRRLRAAAEELMSVLDEA